MTPLAAWLLKPPGAARVIVAEPGHLLQVRNLDQVRVSVPSGRGVAGPVPLHGAQHQMPYTRTQSKSM
jgi:hypothetical protein